MKTQLPFFLIKKKNSRFFYVRFKNLETGKYLNAISTKKETESEAMQEAFRMLSSSKTKERIDEVTRKSFIASSDTKDSDLLLALEEMKRRGLIASVTVTTEKNVIKILDYVLNFWDFEKSEYVKEKLRQGHLIHKNHCVNMTCFIGKYWNDFFKDMTLGAVTKGTIKKMFDFVAELKLSGHSKNSILRSILTPLKYAKSNDIIQNDLTSNLIWFSESYEERKILTPEMAQSIFCIEWKSRKSYLANLIAMTTGMRAGEIRALRVQDLGVNCLYVNHSWNDKEGLKSPKNGEVRTVQFPFPKIIEEMKTLAIESPFYRGIDDFIFWSTKPKQPIDTDVFMQGFRESLVKIGLSEEESKNYVFHSWRHFFATYLSGKLDPKLLQQQTGHKTRAMLEHYAAHRTEKDSLTVQNAQLEIFSPILNLELKSENQ